MILRFARRREVQARQSSTTREISDQGGTTSAGALPTPNATRPRLNAIASRMRSEAAKSAVRRPVPGLKLVGALRESVLVQMVMNGAAPVAGLATDTRRVARAQRSKIWGWLVAPTKVASLPSEVAA